MLGCQVRISRWKRAPAARASLHWPACRSRVLNMQTAQKCSLVMLVNKVNFGEWVKRQRNYPNKTKNKNEKQNNSNHQPCTLQQSSVSPAGITISSKQDFNRTYGFTRTSLYQLSCSNKYLISTNRLTFFDPFKTIQKTITNQKLVIKRTPNISYSKSRL